MILNFGGTNRTSLVKSITATQTLGGRSICDVELVPQEISGAFVPYVGQPIEWLSGGEYLFSGSIESVRQSKYTSTSVIAYSETCADHHRILDRRYTGQREWANATDKQIIGDICNSNLTDEQVDGDTYVVQGLTLEKFSVDYATVGEAINAIAKLAQRFWYMDHAKRIHYFAQGSSAAPFGFAAPCLNAERMEQTTSREGYANKLNVRLGNYVRDPQTARFNATGRVEENGEYGDSSQQTDGSRRYFTVSFPIVSAPTITVDGVQQTVGIQDVDTGKQWYWSSGSATVRPDDGGPTVPNGGTLYVEYVGQESKILSVQNNTEIDLRNGLEDGSGIYESLQDSNTRVTGATANQYAESLLAQIDEHSVTINITTSDYLEPNCVALRPGQTIAISTEGYVAGNYTVRQVRFTGRNGAGEVTCDIEAVKGPILGDAVTFFQSLAQSEGIVATPGPMTPETAPGNIPEPDQPGDSGWSIALGQSSANVQTGEQMQQVIATITRDIPADANYWRIYYHIGATPPAILTDWIYGPAAVSLYPSDTVISDIWIPRTLATQMLHVALSASSFSYTYQPAATMPVKSIAIPALADAPEPNTWSVLAEKDPIPRSGIFYGRFAFAEAHAASPNIAGIDVQRKPFGSADTEYRPVSAYQSTDPATLQAGGLFGWNQGAYEWPWPDNQEQWVFRCGLTDHRMKTTWHPTTYTVTLTAGGGFQVSALESKLGRGMGLGTDGKVTTGAVGNPIVLNPGFDILNANGTPKDWTITTGCSIDASIYEEGGRSIKVVSSAGNWEGPSQLIRVYPGDYIRLTARLRIDSGVGTTAIQAYSAAGSFLGQVTVDTPASPGVWQTADLNYGALPAGTVQVNINPLVFSPGVGKTAYVDSVNFAPAGLRLNLNTTEIRALCELDSRAENTTNNGVGFDDYGISLRNPSSIKSRVFIGKNTVGMISAAGRYVAYLSMASGAGYLGLYSSAGEANATIWCHNINGGGNIALWGNEPQVNVGGAKLRTKTSMAALTLADYWITQIADDTYSSTEKDLLNNLRNAVTKIGNNLRTLEIRLGAFSFGLTNYSDGHDLITFTNP